MTCIVGYTKDAEVFIGGDSAGVSGMDITKRKDSKIFKKNGFIFGFTSSFRMGQLLRYSFDPPKRHPDESIDEYMVTKFVDSVRDCLKSGGYARTDSGEESAGTFLVGHAGRLFRIESDYQVGESLDCYDAVGCGEAYAKGSIFSSTKKSPRDIINDALLAAEHHSAGVCGPFTIESV